MEQIGPDVFVETGYAGVNVAALSTDIGLVCVDSPTIPIDAIDWRTRLRAWTARPVRYLVLTDYHIDRVFTAHLFDTRLVAHEKCQLKLLGYEARFPAPLLDSLSARFDPPRKDVNGAVVAHPQISFCHQVTLQAGSREIHLLHKPSATPGSIWVFVKDEGILFTGDTLVVDQHPNLAEAETDNWLEALDSLTRNEMEAKVIVPGRGPLCTGSAAAALAGFIRRVRDRVYALYNAGRPRADTTTLVSEFIGAFVFPAPTKEWLQRQLKVGLDHVYDEFKTADSSK